jgi:hypothetical protein
LAAQLRAALEQIKLSGCAWVEQGIDDTIE